MANISQSNCVGFEISWNVVRACLVSPTGQVLKYGETKAHHAHENESLLIDAISDLWGKLEVQPGTRVGVALGMKNSGLGSGPEIETWISRLQDRIEKPLSTTGRPATGVAFFPADTISRLYDAIKELGGAVQLAELAPVSLVRLLPANVSCALSFDSSIGWKARVVNGHVLEALAFSEGIGQEEIKVSTGSKVGTIETESQVKPDPAVLAVNGIGLAEIAVSLGAALGVAKSDHKYNFITKAQRVASMPVELEEKVDVQSYIEVSNDQEVIDLTSASVAAAPTQAVEQDLPAKTPTMPGEEFRQDVIDLRDDAWPAPDQHSMVEMTESDSIYSGAGFEALDEFESTERVAVVETLPAPTPPMPGQEAKLAAVVSPPMPDISTMLAPTQMAFDDFPINTKERSTRPGINMLPVAIIAVCLLVALGALIYVLAI